MGAIGKARNNGGQVKTRQQIATGFVALTIVLANAVMLMAEYAQAIY